MNVSVLILTLNEEQNLPRCLESVHWSDDVVVLDSLSDDRTVEIARAHGARVVQRRFDNERDHRMFSVRNIQFKHPWVYNPDADEVTPPELRDEILSVVNAPNRAEVAYRVRFKTLFMGRWIKHCSLYPTWVVRLFRPEKISFERATNLRYVIDGPVGRLQNHFHHYTFNKGFDAWIEKHNRYSGHEAAESLKSLRNGGVTWRNLLSGDPVARRSALKELSFRVPCRPSLRFIYMYVLRRGFLDGRAGLTYCRLLAFYEYMIVLKMKEIRRREAGLPV
jgi:glycosyltransferase involved in cell wall biosynthesis